jgi:hypothetical protein
VIAKTTFFPWTCPACGEKIPDAIPVAMRVEGTKIVFRLADSDLADVVAHAWTHQSVVS